MLKNLFRSKPVTLRVTDNKGRVDTVKMYRADTLAIHHTITDDGTNPNVKLHIEAKAATIEVI